MVWLECNGIEVEFEFSNGSYYNFNDTTCLPIAILEQEGIQGQLSDCDLFEVSCNSSATTEEAADNHLSRGTVGASVAGSGGAVLFTAAGGTGALIAYRRHHDMPVVTGDEIMDTDATFADENAIFASDEVMNQNALFQEH